MVDIREGDILVVGSRQYPVRSVADWSAGNFRLSRRSFARLATVAAHTLRSPALVGGKRGTPVVNVPDLACTPLDPVEPEVARRLGVDTPYELLETYVEDDTGFLQIVLEETKN